MICGRAAGKPQRSVTPAHDARAQHRPALRQRPRGLARAPRGAAARGRAGRLSDRDGLRPRRRRPLRPRGGADLRGQGPAALQPADRACPRSGGGARGSRCSTPRRRAARRGLLARPADAGAAAPAPTPGCRRWSPPACHRWRSGCRRIRWRRRLLARLRRAGRGALGQPLGPGQPDHGPAHVLDGLGGRIAAVLDGGACAVGRRIRRSSASTGARRCCCVPAASRPRRSPTALASRLRSPADPDRPTRARASSPRTTPREAALRLDVAAPGAGRGLARLRARLLAPPASTSRRSATSSRRRPTSFTTCARPTRWPRAAGIAVAPIPDHGLGRAINDRLARAAAPRPASGPASRAEP